MTALRLRTVVAADLDNALEVHVHRIRELEGLEVREAHHRSRRPEVFDLLELAHNLWSHDASVLVDELDRRPFAIMCNAISHQHVELVLIILDGQHHRHCLANLHDSADLTGPRSLADLDLHPTLQVVAEEVRGDGMKHVHLEWPEGDGLLVEVVPGAAKLAGLQTNELEHWKEHSKSSTNSPDPKPPGHKDRTE